MFSTPELGVLASKQGQLAYFTWVSQGFNLSRETKALTPAHVPSHFIKFAGAAFLLKFLIHHHTTYAPLQRFLYELGYRNHPQKQHHEKDLYDPGSRVLCS